MLRTKGTSRHDPTVNPPRENPSQSIISRNPGCKIPRLLMVVGDIMNAIIPVIFCWFLAVSSIGNAEDKKKRNPLDHCHPLGVCQPAMAAKACGIGWQQGRRPRVSRGLCESRLSESRQSRPPLGTLRKAMRFLFCQWRLLAW